MSDQYVLEACVESLAAAKAAAENGFTRLELCQNLVIGGTQPALSLLRAVRENVALPVRVLLRPRAGDFLYDEDEQQMMLKDIRDFRALGAEGIVVGQLTADGQLDRAALAAFREASEGMGFTLHRAFDLCRDPFEALEDAIALGFDTILTSGQAVTAREGQALLQMLQKQADGRIQMMAGSGVNAAVITKLAQDAGITAFHLSATAAASSPMRYRSEKVHMGLPGFDEYLRLYPAPEKLRAASDALKSVRLKRGESAWI